MGNALAGKSRFLCDIMSTAPEAGGVGGITDATPAGTAWSGMAEMDIAELASRTMDVMFAPSGMGVVTKR